jgi:hypothetical protein
MDAEAPGLIRAVAEKLKVAMIQDWHSVLLPSLNK